MMQNVFLFWLWALGLLIAILQTLIKNNHCSVSAMHFLKKRGESQDRKIGKSNVDRVKNVKSKPILDLNTLPPPDTSDDENIPATLSLISQTREGSTSSSSIMNKERKGKRALPGWRVKYNLKRKLKRQESRKSNLKEHQANLKKEYEQREKTLKARQEEWEQNPKNQYSRYNDFSSKRSQIRKYVREGKGTEVEKEYVKEMNRKDYENRKKKKAEKKIKSK